MPTLETERLTLRAPTPRDLPDYAAFYAVSDVKVGGYRGNRTPHEISTILSNDVAHWDAKGFGIFLLHSKADGTFFGGAGLSHPENSPSHELTWWLLPETRGTGLATEASRAIIAWAYDTLKWDRVETHMRDENLPAHKLARRLGGTVDRRGEFPDGVVRDVYLLPKGAGA